MEHNGKLWSASANRNATKQSILDGSFHRFQSGIVDKKTPASPRWIANHVVLFDPFTLGWQIADTNSIGRFLIAQTEEEEKEEEKKEDGCRPPGSYVTMSAVAVHVRAWTCTERSESVKKRKAKERKKEARNVEERWALHSSLGRSHRQRPSETPPMSREKKKQRNKETKKRKKRTQSLHNKFRLGFSLSFFGIVFLSFFYLARSRSIHCWH